MKNTLEIYIEGTRLDLFKDESITIKTSSKDFKDIDKIFTSFSRKLTIPASKVNNRIFKHYSNSSIVSGGFDARALKRAELKLNGNTLEKGKVSLESVKKRNGEIDSYSIRFYGALTEFKKRLGEDYIHNVDTSADNISNPDYPVLLASTSASINDPVVFPLASTQNRFIYHSTDPNYAHTQGYERTKNIAYINSTRTDSYGITADELVGAYKVGNMLDNISNYYNLNLTGAIQADYIQDYRILLNSAGRENRDTSLIEYTDKIPNLTEDTYDLPSVLYSDYDESDTITSTNPVLTTTTTRLAEVDHSEYQETTLRLTENFRRHYGTLGLNVYNSTGNQLFQKYATTLIDCQFRVYVSTALSNFEVRILKNGERIGTITESSSAGDDRFIHNTNSANDSGNITFQVSAAGTGTVNVYYRLSINNYVIGETGTYEPVNENEHYTSYDSFSISTTATGESGYIVNSYLPKMKVKEFFGVLIKQFNLIPTVTLNDNGTHEINFKHYDYYINQGTTRDITKYVDISSEEIAPSNLYSGLSFSHNDPKTAMEDAYFQVNRRKYGSLEYEYEEDGEKLSGSLFEFKIPTHRIPLERLEDLDDGDLSLQTWLQLTDINSNSTSIGATFIYCTRPTLGSVAFDNGVTVESVFKPVNASNVYYTTNSVHDTYASVGNYWGGELNEYFRNETFQGLGNFNLFWYNYTRIMFDERTRKVSLSAFLPEGLLITLTPADTLVIGDRTFLIESYSTDYGTGKTNLELMEVQKTVLDEFQSNQITTTIPSGTPFQDFVQVYLKSSDGQIGISPFETVNCIGGIKWINIV